MTTISRPISVIRGVEMNKEWRQTKFGRIAGGAGSREMEIYQRKMVEEGTGAPCVKTNMRINLRTSSLIEIAHPNTRQDGFDYSEDFDGKQVFDTMVGFLNFKSIASSGGAQTRSLREVYWFVEGQLNVLKTGMTNVYFANILDGDEPANHMDKFKNLLGLPEFESVRHSVYVGDLYGYFDWLNALLVMKSELQ